MRLRHNPEALRIVKGARRGEGQAKPYEIGAAEQAMMQNGIKAANAIAKFFREGADPGVR